MKFFGKNKQKRTGQKQYFLKPALAALALAAMIAGYLTYARFMASASVSGNKFLTANGSSGGNGSFISSGTFNNTTQTTGDNVRLNIAETNRVAGGLAWNFTGWTGLTEATGAKITKVQLRMEASCTRTDGSQARDETFTFRMYNFTTGTYDLNTTTTQRLNTLADQAFTLDFPAGDYTNYFDAGGNFRIQMWDTGETDNDQSMIRIDYMYLVIYFDDTNPVATWSSPNGNPSPYYTNAAGIPLQVTGTDNTDAEQSGISSMNFFYNNGTEQSIGSDTVPDTGTATSGTWSFSWNPVDGTYSVYARAVDGKNNTSPNTATQTIIVDRTNPTAAITDPAAGNTISGNYAIKGTAGDTNFNNYKVEYYKVGVGPWTQIGTTQTTPVNNGVLVNWDTGTVANGLYDLRLTVTDQANNTATHTITNVNVQSDATPPNAITTLSTTAVSGNRVDLQWSQGSDNPGGSGLKQYRVFRNGTQINTVAENGSTTYSYQATGLTPSTSYNFEIRAEDNAGNIQTTGNNVVNVTTLTSDTTPPSAVTNLAANTLSHSSVRLTWSKSTDNRGVYSYEVYQNGNPTPIANIIDNGSTGYSYDVTGLSPNTLYTYEVKAVDLDGNKSTGNNQASATTNAPPDTTPPSIVQGLTATALGAGRIELEWSKSTDNIGVDHYEIYQNGVLVANVPDSGAATFRYSVTGLTPSTLYTYKLNAVDAAGNRSPDSANVSETTPVSTDPLPPNAVTSLTAQAVSTTRVKLSWNAGTDNIGVTEYRVMKDNVLLTVVKDNGASGYSYYVTGLAPTTAYTFEIIAVDKEGNLSTGNNQRTLSTMTADTTPPSQPTGLTVTFTRSNEAGLAWQASTDDVAVSKYKVYRSENGGPYKVMASPGGASFTASGLKSGTPYAFKVTALDAANNESTAGAVVNTTTTVDTTAPQITHYEPWADEVDIGQADLIKVDFDDGLNLATVDGTTVYLKDNNNVTMPATVTYDDTTNTVVLDPTANLGQGIKYTVYVVGGAGGVKNSANIALAQTFSWSFTAGASTFTIAHGNYTNDTGKCRLCHTLHNGQSPGLVKESTQTGMCFTCHDGTASNYNIAGIYAADSGNITAHPVKDTELVTGELIRCSDCHNPHGTFNSGGGYYPRLLKAYNGTGFVNDGPDFCLACHGSVNRGWSSVYYQNTMGDHSNANAAHYDTSKTALRPPSGTNVTCVMCHDKHASSNNRLIREDQGTEDTLCFKCHNNIANSMSARNIQSEFNRAGSRHNIFDTDQADGSKVECRSCHGPHTVKPVRHSTGLNVSDISDPDNTYNFFTKIGGTGRNPAESVGSLSEFCIKCHDNSPPVKSMVTTVDINGNMQSTTQVPFTIRFPNNPAVNFTSNNTGWDKRAFTTSGHFTGTDRVDCDLCHEQHGSDYPRLQLRAEDTATTNGICLYCHAGNAGFPSAPNIKADLSKASKHPTLTTNGMHADTENYNNMAVANRHAECVDCHDPHSAGPDSSATPPARSNILKNVSGVGIGARAAWTSLDPSSNVYVFKKAIDNQYELCYKCHSSYSAAAGTAPTRDIAKEFNPANKAFHPVEADSPNAKGIFVAGYSATSRLWCSDCHGREGGGAPRGPHGSANPKILKGVYDSTTGYGNSGHLCFNCHSYTAYSQFSDRTYESSSATGFTGGGKGNLHYYHAEKLNGRGDNIRCQYCHAAVVHGANENKHLIVTTSSPAPYKGAAKLVTYTDPGSNNYSVTSCASGISPCNQKH